MGRTYLPRSPRVDVTVTEEVIEGSKKRDSSHCMIAEAVKASFPDAKLVSVDLQTIRFSDPKKGLRYTYLTPRIGQVALIEFDQGVTPEPFSMRLQRGQVTAIRKNRDPLQGNLTEEERAARREHGAMGGHARAEALRRSTIRTEGKDRPTPEKVGGRTPPTTPFARRRAFGLRALER